MLSKFPKIKPYMGFFFFANISYPNIGGKNPNIINRKRKENDMRDLSELNKLEAYLKDHNIPYERDDGALDLNGIFDRHIIIVYSQSGEREWDAICQYGSYGGDNGLIEIMGTIVQNDEDDVEGWLTADDIINRIKEES